MRLPISTVLMLAIVLCDIDGATIENTGRIYHRSSSRTAKKTLRKIIVYTYGLTIAEIYRSPLDRSLQYCKLTELSEGSECAPALEKIGRPVRNICHKKMIALINECMELKNEGELSDEKNLGDDTGYIAGFLNGIYPGTKWCGSGHIAKNYFDLGSQIKVDKCCRAHDHCPIKVLPWRWGYGETNWSLYTLSHCDCDVDFYRCLISANSTAADTVGDLFFNTMRVDCLREKPGTTICPNRPVRDPGNVTENECRTAFLVNKVVLHHHITEMNYPNRTASRRSLA